MILLLDSSGNFLVAGLADSRRGVVAEAAHATGSPASRNISAVVDELQDGAGSREIDGVIAGTGPGTFIGTRMAVSFANGLAAAAGFSVQGVSSLAAIAAQQPPGTAVIRDARQGQAYLYLAASDKEQTELVHVEQLAPRIRSGGFNHVVLEAARDGDARGERRVAELAESLSGIAEVELVDMVPLSGLWAAGQGVPGRDYIEPEYHRGFL